MPDDATRPSDAPLVLITGAAGLLGTAIARDLRRDHRVVGLDLQVPDDWPGDECLRCDLTEDESVDEALRRVADEHGERIASVIHLAAYYDFSGEDSPLYDELTVGGTRRLLERLQERDVGQLAFSSSLLAMKPAEEGALLEEDDPLEAAWPYPQSKIDAEAVIREVHGSVPAVILRIAGVYDDGCHSIPIAQHIRRIYEKELDSVFFPGNPHHGQAFVHLDDVVSAFRATIEHRDELDDLEVFFVAEEDVMSYGELQDRIGGLVHGRAWPTIRVPAPAAKAGAWIESKLRDEDDVFIKPWMVDLADAAYPVSIRRARERLGWAPEHRLRESLAGMVERLEDDPRAWYEENDLPVPEGLATESA